MTVSRENVRLPSASYRQGRHQDPGHVDRYESAFAEPRRGPGILWPVEQRLLQRVLDEVQPRTALDFACGTGRVLAWLARQVDEATGVDVSAPMVERATAAAREATVVRGDLTVTPELLPQAFDLVAMFRFLLNAEPALRDDALAWVAGHLADDGVLVVNTHRTPCSLTGLTARARRALRRSATPRTLSVRELGELLDAHGFDVVARYGYGYLPYGPHGGWRLPFPRLVCALESRLAGAGARVRVASHVLVVARRRGHEAGVSARR